MAVTLTGSDDQGETKTGLDAPSYRFSLAMRRVHRAGTGLRLFLLGTVQSMQSSNITVVKETGDLCSLDLSFNSMSALLVISSTLLSEASVVLDQPDRGPPRAGETGGSHGNVGWLFTCATGDLEGSQVSRLVFSFGWISQDEHCKTYLLAFAARARKSGADGGTRFHLRSCGL